MTEVSVKDCSVGDCAREHYAKGKCRLHWGRDYYGLAPEKLCSFHGCNVVGPTFRNRCPEHQGVKDTKGPMVRYMRKLDREAKQEHYRRGNLSKFNLTPEEYDEQNERQGSQCAICARETASRRMAVDHDHKCCVDRGESCGECLRGLLCADCNGGLGFFSDDISRLESAITYLQRGGVWGIPKPQLGGGSHRG